MRYRKLVGLMLTLVLAGLGGVAPRPTAAEPPAEEAWQGEALGFRMEAALSKARYGVAEPIIAKVDITNVTDTSRTFSTHVHPELWFLRGADQLDVPIELTRYGRFLYGKLPLHPREGSHAWLPFLPGEPRTYYVPLNAIADLTVEGTYTVEIGLGFQDAVGNRAVLGSGPLVFGVNSWGGDCTRQEILEFGKRDPTPEVARQLAERLVPALEDLAYYARKGEPEELRQEAGAQLQKLSELIEPSLGRVRGSAPADQ